MYHQTLTLAKLIQSCRILFKDKNKTMVSQKNHGSISVENHLENRSIFTLDLVINSFHATGLFLYPLKTSGFLMISGGIERDQWHETG